jgi:retron-type reverse transcriptase
VVQHAVMNICGPVFEKSLISDTYAAIKGRGQHRAVKKAEKNAGKNEFFLKMDIRKYFDSIDHFVLKQLIAEKIKDKKVLYLFSKIIDSYNVTDGKGLPIGNLTSQYFANLYLSKYDHFIKEKMKCKFYVRYMDDFIIWSNDKDFLLKIRDKSKKFLQTELDLKLKAGGIINRVKNGFNFLGYRIFKNKFRLTKRSKERFKRKFNYYEKLFMCNNIDEYELQLRMTALFDFVLSADSVFLRKRMIALSELNNYQGY